MDDPDLDFLRAFAEQVRTLREHQLLYSQTRDDYDLATCKRLETEVDAALSHIPRKM